MRRGRVGPSRMPPLVARRTEERSDNYIVFQRGGDRMSTQKHGECCENSAVGSDGIESAFETMVQQWLVQGANGKWQRALPKKKTIKKPGDCSTGPIKIMADKTNDVHPKQAKGSYSTHIHSKLTADFLQRSKMRLLTCSDAGFERSDHETGNPTSGEQTPAGARPRNDVPVVVKYPKLEHSSNTEIGRVKCLSTTQVTMSKTSESVAVFNDEVPPCGDTSAIEPTSSGKCAAPSSKLKGVKRAKTSRSKTNTSNVTVEDQPDSCGVHNAKVEMETEECRRIARITMSAQAETTSATAKECKVSSEQESEAIPILCNGQIKCKIDYCYKAAGRRGLCAAHEEDNTCVARGCNNLPFSLGLCRSHVGCKPRAPGENRCNAVQQTTVGAKVENSEGAKLKAPEVVNHDESSNTKSAMEIPPSADIEEASASLPDSSRPKLQTATEHSKPPASNAWNSSDLPSLFRAAGPKRESQTETSLKREDVDIGGTATATRKGKRARDDRSNVCKARGCMGEVACDEFCRKHAKYKRCKEHGCGNLAGKGRQKFCWRHIARKECLVDGCTVRARVRGRCSKHGGKYICREEGCSKTAYAQGLCVAHLRQARNQSAQQA